MSILSCTVELRPSPGPRKQKPRTSAHCRIHSHPCLFPDFFFIFCSEKIPDGSWWELGVFLIATHANQIPSSLLPITPPSPTSPQPYLTIIPPSPHHHLTIIPPSPHHHLTITNITSTLPHHYLTITYHHLTITS